MTDVKAGEEREQQDPLLSAADKQLRRELTERAWAGGLKLTGEGGLPGKLTEMEPHPGTLRPSSPDVDY